MFTIHKVLNDDDLKSIYQYEEEQLHKFKNEFDNVATSVARLRGWSYNIRLYRWTDYVSKLNDKTYDGYTATLQIDFTDHNNCVVEFDENVCSFFENITYISFNPIRKVYRVYQNEGVEEIRTDVSKFIRSLE